MPPQANRANHQGLVPTPPPPFQQLPACTGKHISAGDYRFGPHPFDQTANCHFFSPFSRAFDRFHLIRVPACGHVCLRVCRPRLFLSLQLAAADVHSLSPLSLYGRGSDSTTASRPSVSPISNPRRFLTGPGSAIGAGVGGRPSGLVVGGIGALGGPWTPSSPSPAPEEA